MLLTAFLLALASAMYTCYWIGHTEGVRESGGILTDFEYSLDGFHIVISFSLAVSVIGLCSRRFWGLIISMLGLLGVLMTYGYWHFWTIEYLSELHNYPQLYKRVQEERGFFHGGTKWDFVVLAFAASLLLLELVKLTKIILKRRRSSAKD